MESAVEVQRGAAAIKEQFLTTKEQFHEFLASGRPRQSTDEADGDSEEPSGEPEQKRVRLDSDGDKKKKKRGQNKSRPHVKPQSYEDRRLCPSIVQERDTKCFYGEKCRFLHDASEYMSTKAADLSDQCYLFNSFGWCQYGVTCRFAKAHTSPELKNLRNQDLCRRSTDTVRNLLDKELQRRLRKKQERFPGAEAYLKTVSRGEKPASNREENLSGAGHTQDGADAPVKTVGPITDADIIKLRPCEKKQVDFRDKLYLAPLTTCGNLPFRRVCKRFGADITCGEMAMCTNLLQGQTSEWALLKRHASEDLFGVQLEGCFPDTMTRCAELLNQNIDVDFVDINSGCPIDLVYKKGGGCGLMTRTSKFEQIVRGMNSVLDVPLTVKIRTGVQQNCSIAHKLIPEMKKWGVSLITLHGRSREQRYTKSADWEYIDTCSKLAAPVPLFGNGDILSYEDAMKARETGVSGIMVARGALIKPWLFTEIKENRHWDISSGERLDILRDFTNYGLEHWGSDTQGVEKTRSFLLEWLSFLCRYIPVGLLERVPQKINERPPFYMGRDYMESLMASQHVDDWIQIRWCAERSG
ncbi:tRNA-dihydrouridine(47) synthase [NAD(P)(+)]-like [Sinocyclocheilus rhinocerous]|uniref:tRNA-dihydrouridine(47) synthase [NAD(P)(+)]-like n=1 Tax=Sinocyclocheilus rhinocerous TaxID=307959 RepID=UPI0007B89B70|nr:PREDICTED: tRNA-dihydrouridine(47) synthase [NAD(P)(+)]-like [Sinocyclocheilus rhinocerous]